MENTNAFTVGDIVTMKSHPLFNKKIKKIACFSAHVPPLMLIKEVFFELIDKKQIFSTEVENAQIADLIKYNCMFFNANKSIFEEKIIYHSLLKGYKELKYYREVEKNKKGEVEIDKQLIAEVLKYKVVSEYTYGDVVQFKTKKLEHRKSYDIGFERIPGNTFQTPDFVLSGIKNEPQTDLYYNNGDKKRIISNQLFKVTWFNHFQQKFSEKYLPKEFFVKELEIN